MLSLNKKISRFGTRGALNASRAFAAIMLLILIPFEAQSQWKLLKDFSGSEQSQITTIYFLNLPGLPRVGFLGLTDADSTGEAQVWKTVDGGWTWNQLGLANGPLFFGELPNSFTFKDSLTGWLSSYNGAGFTRDPNPNGCLKTTDGGETWEPISMPGPNNSSWDIYYHHATDLLFVENDIVGALVSTDEGSTWQYMPVGQFTSCAFSSDSIGIFGGDDGGGTGDPTNSYTTDGGKTWTHVSANLDTYHPLAIKGTGTFFMMAGGQGLCRSDDSGKTWRVIPTSPIVAATNTLYGDLDHLYTHGHDAVYVSTDTGNSWQNLCGPGGSTPPGFYQRSNYIYAAGAVTNETSRELWYLNLDSLNIFSSSLHPTQSTASGNGMSVLFQPQIDSTVGVDTAHFAIRYDSSLLLQSLQLPAGWNLLDSSSNGNTLNVTIFDTSSVVSNPNVTLTFEPILTPSGTSGKVWLDSANLFGKWMSCDISAQSSSAPDSVQLDFSGCGDSLILAAMEHTPPFSIQSIVPNPAENEVRVSGPGIGVPGMDVEMYNVLGRTQDVRSTSLQGGLSLDVSGVPPGIYYLRFSSNGYVETRSISIQR